MKESVKKLWKIFFISLMIVPSFYLINPSKVVEKEIPSLSYKKSEPDLVLKPKPPEVVIKPFSETIIISSRPTYHYVAVGGSGDSIALYAQEDNTYQEWQGTHQIALQNYIRI